MRLFFRNVIFSKRSQKRSQNRSLQARLARLGGVIFCAYLGLGAAAWADTEIYDVRFGVKGDDKTRIVLDLTDDTKYRADIREDEQGQKFLAVDLAKTTFNIANKPSATGMGKGIGLMGSYAWSTTLTGRGQFLFSLNEAAVPTTVFMLKPKDDKTHYRLVIDMAATSEADFTAAIGRKYGALEEAKKPVLTATDKEDGREAPFGVAEAATREIAIAAAEKAKQASQPLTKPGKVVSTNLTKVVGGVPVPRRKPNLEALEAADGRFTIVLDPGHGGKHPGSVGSTGLIEKNVTLAAAKTLKAMLQKRGYRVMMTRDADKYVDLQDRMEFARAQKADLFLSIHADGNLDKTIRGASVYTLSDKGSDRLANETKAKGDFQLVDFDASKVDSNVSQIIFDMSAKKTREESSILADMMIEDLTGEITMLNNTHRQANLKVLLSPDVPAVLLELAFISNVSDEKNLNSRTWRTKAMRAVAGSIDTYFEGKKPQKHAMNAVVDE